MSYRHSCAGGTTQDLYSSGGFLRRLAGDTARAATSEEVKDLRHSRDKRLRSHTSATSSFRASATIVVFLQRLPLRLTRSSNHRANHPTASMVDFPAPARVEIMVA